MADPRDWSVGQVVVVSRTDLGEARHCATAYSTVAWLVEESGRWRTYYQEGPWTRDIELASLPEVAEFLKRYFDKVASS